jgi:hypothetical protein
MFGPTLLSASTSVETFFIENVPVPPPPPLPHRPPLHPVARKILKPLNRKQRVNVLTTLKTPASKKKKKKKKKKKVRCRLL